MNLIITCARHLESETTDELSAVLAQFGDENPEISRTSMSGILTAKTKLVPFEVIKNIRQTILDAGGQSLDRRSYTNYETKTRKRLANCYIPYVYVS